MQLENFGYDYWLLAPKISIVAGQINSRRCREIISFIHLTTSFFRSVRFIMCGNNGENPRLVTCLIAPILIEVLIKKIGSSSNWYSVPQITASEEHEQISYRHVGYEHYRPGELSAKQDREEDR